MEPAIVDSEFAVPGLGVDLDEALVELDVPPRIILLGLHGGGNHRVDADDRCDQHGATRFERLGSCAIKRALFVDDVSQSKRGGKFGQPIELKFKVVKVTKVSAFQQRFVAMKHDAKLSLDHAVLAQIGDAQHEGKPAVQWRDNDRFAKQNPRGGSRESNKDEAGHDGEQKHSAHNLDGGDDVAVERLGIHVPVTDGGKRLHAEEKRFEKRTRYHPRNAVSAEHIEGGKDEVEHDVNGSDKQGELRPAQSEQPLIGVAPIESLRVNLDELDLTGPN